MMTRLIALKLQCKNPKCKEDFVVFLTSEELNAKDYPKHCGPCIDGKEKKPKKRKRKKRKLNFMRSDYW